MSVFRVLLAACLSLCLTACGGGGGSSEAEESFSGTITRNQTTHVCNSRPAWDLCEAGNCAQCQCLTGCTSTITGDPITKACERTEVADQTWAFEAKVPQAGCTQEGTSPRTWVCNGTTLHMLAGVGYSRAQVIAAGARFQGSGSLTWNDTQFTCTTADTAPPSQG